MSTPSRSQEKLPSDRITEEQPSASNSNSNEYGSIPKRSFFRSTLFQILVVGSCAFCSPGIWSAMNGLGVGGSASPDLVNAANAILYGFMTITCFLGPWLTNLIGFRWTLAAGALGYPIYAAGLYCNNRFGNIWFVYVGAVACGISAGFFWSVEGAIATGYPEQHKRGRYIATWFSFRNFGNVIGGSISLAINVNRSELGSIGYATYLAFIAIQCLGFFIGLLLSNPEKVVRDDGTRIEAPRGIKWLDQAKGMWKMLCSPSFLLLIPLFWYLGWMQAYPGTYLATYFTVRSRSLGSLLYAVVGTFATWMAGLMVDVPWSKDRRTRAITTYIFIASVTTGTWIWAVIIQNEYRFTHPVLDWANQSTFGRGFGLYLFERWSFGMVENYVYWCISNLSDSPGDQIRYSSLLRGIETASVAISFGVQAVPTALIVTASLNFAIWMVALPFSYYATVQVVRKFRKLHQDESGAVDSLRSSAS